MADEDSDVNEENPENEDIENEGAFEDETGEENEENDDEDEGFNRLFIIIGAIAVLLIAVGAGLYFTGMLDSILGKSKECVEQVDENGEVIKACPEEQEGDDQAKKDGKGAKDGQEAKAGGNFLEVPTILVNLSSDDGTPRYLRLTVQLELSSSQDHKSVEAVIPRVVDKFQTYLRELRVKDLRGSAGIYRLQMELLWRVNQAAAPVKVKDVLFQEIIIQ